MEIKATRYDSTPIPMSKIKNLIILTVDLVKGQHLSINASGSMKWSSHLGRQLEVSYKKLSIILSYDLVIMLLGIYLTYMEIFLHHKSCTKVYSISIQNRPKLESEVALQ